MNTGWVWEKSSVLSIRETYASSYTCLWSRKMIPLPMLHTTISGLKTKPNSLQYTLADMLVVQVSQWQISFPITLLFFFKISLGNANNVHIFNLGMLMIHLQVAESRNLLTIYIKYVINHSFSFSFCRWCFPRVWPRAESRHGPIQYVWRWQRRLFSILHFC